MSKVEHPAQILFTEKHPLTASLNMKFTPEGKDLRVDVKAPAGFCDADGKHVHTGFHTLLLDTVLGACAIGNLEKLQPIATIKLNCQHVHKVPVGEPLICKAIWAGEEHSISYVTGDIRRASDNVIVSSAIGTFMIGTAARPLAEKQGNNG